MKNDYYYMKRALSLARKGAGKTSPEKNNPPSIRRIISEGNRLQSEYKEDSDVYRVN